MKPKVEQKVAAMEARMAVELRQSGIRENMITPFASEMRRWLEAGGQEDLSYAEKAEAMEAFRAAATRTGIY